MAEYIDRQAVLDAIFPVDPENDGSDGCTVVLQNQSFTSADIEGIVCSIPAANVRTVVHGRWIWRTENKYRCNNCGRHTLVDEVMDEPVYNYCPYCGAQMDGGANQ